MNGIVNAQGGNDGNAVQLLLKQFGCLSFVITGCFFSVIASAMSRPVDFNGFMLTGRSFSALIYVPLRIQHQ